MPINLVGVLFRLFGFLSSINWVLMNRVPVHVNRLPITLLYSSDEC